MFRLLSLDGGGIKGTFTASVLASLEQQTGRRIIDHFDLIVGTSPGGILAIGLGLGFPAATLLSFYRDRGPEIFPSTGLAGHVGWIRQIFGPKHSHKVLRNALIDVLGDQSFGGSRTRLVIPTYDAISGRIYIMKTAHSPRFVNDIKASAVDVALATSAAPTYFAAANFPQHGNASYVDGGVWANCPALIGVIEALVFLGVRSGDINVLSVGVTSEAFNIAQHRRSGLLCWNRGLIDLMFQAQVEAAQAEAKLLVGGQLHRVDFVAKQGQYSLDNAKAETLRQLEATGHAVATKKEHIATVASRFLNGEHVSPFQPLGGPDSATWRANQPCGSDT